MLWKTLAEWADVLYEHVRETGQLGSIVTVYELFHSDETSGCAFAALPESLWRRTLQTLEATGRAKLFESEGGGANPLELGIKFF